MINKAIIVGHLGGDPEIRYTPNGTQTATFSVATTERYKDAQGEAKEHTEWHKIVAWKRLAEICGEYLHKGSKVYLEGKIQTRKWQDKEGHDRYTTEIVLREMKMLDGRPAGESKGGGSDGQGHAPSPSPGMGEDVPF